MNSRDSGSGCRFPCPRIPPCYETRQVMTNAPGAGDHRGPDLRMEVDPVELETQVPGLEVYVWRPENMDEIARLLR